MARGRIISKSLSTSEKRAALHVSVPELAEFCQQLYPLLVAHADDFGRLQGDAFTVKHAIDPSSPRRLPDFERALAALDSVSLIRWYELSGRRYIQVERFDEHQVGLKKRTASKFPAPRGDSGNEPESPGVSETVDPDVPVKFQEIPSEGKGTELNLTEPKEKIPRASRAAFDAWFEIYPRQEDAEKAWAEWKKLKLCASDISAIMAATRQQLTSRAWLEDGGKYIPMPKNWLRGKRWNDRVPVISKTNPPRGEPYHWSNCPHATKCGSLRECSDLKHAERSKAVPA